MYVCIFYYIYIYYIKLCRCGPVKGLYIYTILCSVSGSHTTALNGFKRVIILYWTSQSMAWLVPAMSSRKRLTCG